MYIGANNVFSAHTQYDCVFWNLLNEAPLLAFAHVEVQPMCERQQCQQNPKDSHFSPILCAALALEESWR